MGEPTFTVNETRQWTDAGKRVTAKLLRTQATARPDKPVAVYDLAIQSQSARGVSIDPLVDSEPVLRLIASTLLTRTL